MTFVVSEHGGDVGESDHGQGLTLAVVDEQEVADDPKAMPTRDLQVGASGELDGCGGHIVVRFVCPPGASSGADRSRKNVMPGSRRAAPRRSGLAAPPAGIVRAEGGADRGDVVGGERAALEDRRVNL
jgi:hypothetical protein